MNVRGALPGLVVMALIAGAGVLFAFVVREVLPDDLFVAEPYGALQVEDIEMDPATGLPIVPTSLFTEPTWWTAVGTERAGRFELELRLHPAAWESSTLASLS